MKISFDLDHGKCLRIVRNLLLFALWREEQPGKPGSTIRVGQGSGLLRAALYEGHLLVQAAFAAAWVVGLLRVHIEQHGLTALE